MLLEGSFLQFNFRALQVKTGLQHLHRSLQNYSATFEEMNKFSPDSKAKIRSKIIGGVAEQLTQVRTNNYTT
jgi:hypothetical protein